VPKKISDEEKKLVLKLHSEGLLNFHISKQTGLNKHTIKKIVENSGEISHKSKVYVQYKLTEEAKAAIDKMNADGIPKLVISKKLGISRPVITKYLKESNQQATFRPDYISDDDKNTILEMNAAGELDIEISEKVGRSTNAVRNFLSKNNREPIRSKGEFVDSGLHEIIREMADKGHSVIEISNKINKPYGSISLFCKKHSIDIANKMVTVRIKPYESDILILNREKLNCTEIHRRIVKKFGVSPDKESIRLFLIKNNLEVHKKINDSSFELEVLEFVKRFYPSAHKLVEHNEKGRKFEVDIYIPELKLAIETNGDFFHSDYFTYKTEKKIKDRAIEKGLDPEVEFTNKLQNNHTKHKRKYDTLLSRNIRLISIFEHEWVEKEAQIKGFLTSVLGKNTKIYARKTEAKFIDKKDAAEFLDRTHIQGSTRFDTAVGLYFGDKLVGVTTFGKHHRKSDEEVTVLSRMSFESGITVVGGATKMLKFASTKIKGKVVSWSDNRWSQGGIYKSMGFTYDAALDPDYFYIGKNQEIRSKQSTKKEWLVSQGADIGLTERLMAVQLGYFRVYDCGKIRWTITL